MHVCKWKFYSLTRLFYFDYIKKFRHNPFLPLQVAQSTFHWTLEKALNNKGNNLIKNECFIVMKKLPHTQVARNSIAWKVLIWNDPLIYTNIVPLIAFSRPDIGGNSSNYFDQVPSMKANFSYSSFLFLLLLLLIILLVHLPIHLQRLSSLLLLLFSSSLLPSSFHL